MENFTLDGVDLITENENKELLCALKPFCVLQKQINWEYKDVSRKMRGYFFSQSKNQVF